ncbi:sucrase ferredoxin [Nocardia sp. alder85J]|uniref:sucrase ferredoxin n=1 Tax=Nocardia sp. alder85J TaxID=2862949 RepID=UPI001CD46E6A|nr:sucrase ferredoxin [Nocardia sp. alder85J]MCX4091520.1 sucrase ferredoxin [Nocardia sp. alder85J]
MTTATDYRCAAWTRDQGVDPIGSAPTCDTLVLIEVPPPWPRDVNTLPAFADILARGPHRTRLLAVRPGTSTRSATGPAVTAIGATENAVPVTIWRRTGHGRCAGTDYVLPADHLADTVTELVAARAFDATADAPAHRTGQQVVRGSDRPTSGAVAVRPPGHALDAADPPGRDGTDLTGRPAPAEVLLCGHGVRDKCCGRLGARLALEVGAGVAGVRVRSCSHTGGHRFAPTGLTLPDGLAWSFLDAALLDGIVRRAGAPPLHDGHYRGNTALDRWGQVAERELFRRFGWPWLDRRITLARTEIEPGGRAAVVELAWSGPDGAGSARAEVGIVRDVPVLICGEHPEAARKAAPELELRSLRLGD